MSHWFLKSAGSFISILVNPTLEALHLLILNNLRDFCPVILNLVSHQFYADFNETVPHFPNNSCQIFNSNWYPKVLDNVLVQNTSTNLKVGGTC